MSSIISQELKLVHYLQHMLMVLAILASVHRIRRNI